MAPETSQPTKSPPMLRHARFEDYPRIAQLESSNGLESQPESDWRGIWLDNPLWPRLSSRWPIGWVLEDTAANIVGSIMNVPSLYTFQGRELICANGRAWVSYPQYRSFALILMDEYFNQDGADLFINTTVGPMALNILNELAVRVPLGDWESISYWITGYPRFAQIALEKMRVPLRRYLATPAAKALQLKDSLFNKSLPNTPASIVVEQSANFDSRFDGFWTELASQNQHKLLAVRDRPTLSWHFAVPLRRGRLWIFTASRNGRLRAYCILKRHDQPGGIRRMRLVDYQTLEPDQDFLPSLLQSALRRCAAEGIDILDHLGRGLPKMQAVDKFAPYRQKLTTWPFYYRATDPALCANSSNPEFGTPPHSTATPASNNPFASFHLIGTIFFDRTTTAATCRRLGRCNVICHFPSGKARPSSPISTVN